MSHSTKHETSYYHNLKKSHVIKLLFYDESTSSVLRDLNILIPSFKPKKMLYMRRGWPELKVYASIHEL